MARSTMGADAAMTVRQTSDCSFPDLSRCAQCLSGGFLASWYLSPVMSDTLAQRASASPAVTASSIVDAAEAKAENFLMNVSSCSTLLARVSIAVCCLAARVLLVLLTSRYSRRSFSSPMSVCCSATVWLVVSSSRSSRRSSRPLMIFCCLVRAGWRLVSWRLSTCCPRTKSASPGRRWLFVDRPWCF